MTIRIKNKKSLGFTIFELLIVTIIMGILSLIILYNYRKSQNQFALQRSVYKLAQDVRRTSEMAMAAKKIGANLPWGYGVYVNRSVSDKSYIIYADIDGSNFYEPSNDVVVETVDLEQRIIIQSVNPDPVCINFRKPAPTIKIQSAPGVTSNLGQIILSDGATLTKTIEVNPVGMIDIK